MNFACAKKHYLIINSKKEYDLFNDNFNFKTFSSLNLVLFCNIKSEVKFEN